jgi:hypothetical protein
MKILKVISKGLQFWVTQNFIEVFVILGLGYLGIDAMGDFCIKCLFIENLEGTAVGIGIKTLIFFLPYLLLFTVINFIPHFKGVQNKLKYAVLNAIISCSIITLIGVLKPKDLKEIFLPLFASFVSSLIIIGYTKYKATR